jgi:hypothetical protein
MTGTWRGCTAARPRIPSARPAAHDRARPSRSPRSGWADIIGAGSPAARAATNTRERTQPSAPSPVVPRSAARSASPSPREATAGCTATSKARSTPSAVSSSACTGRAPPASSTAVTSAADSTFGRRTAVPAGRAARSRAPHGEVSARTAVKA